MRYFVEEDGAVDYEEVVAGGHVAECLGIDEVVECREERFRRVESFVNKPSIWSGGVD